MTDLPARLIRAPLLILLLYLAAPWVITARGQGNPFLSGSQPPGQGEGPAEQRSASPFLLRIAGWQRVLHRTLTGALKAAGEGEPGSLFPLLGASMLYGSLHALGPGHRKAVLAGYLLGHRISPVRGAATGLLMALVHGGTAVVLVGVLYLTAVRSLLMSVHRVETALIPVTYGVIILLGGWMILEGIRFRKEFRKSSPGLWGIVSASMVPCPAATAMLLFALTAGSLMPGLMAVFCMSLGMGVVLGGLGASGSLLRHRLTALIGERNHRATVERVLHLVGGALLVLFGLIMLGGVGIYPG